VSAFEGTHAGGVAEPGPYAGGVSEQDRIARAELSRLVEPGDVELGRLLGTRSPTEVVAGIRSGHLPTRQLSSWRTRLPDCDAGRDLATMRRLEGRFVVPGDAEWPSGLADLGGAEPVGLWVRGRHDLAELARRSVAVVGARASTSYGEHVAACIAGGLAERGWAVVSGGAYGIDGSAHRAALGAGGATMAVLACGADLTYPRGHETLLRRVAAEGLVVSELPPGSTPSRLRFLHRNRVIAALTGGTVVIEAAVRSGARSTANRAVELLRPVMAVPGPVTSAMSAGCHELLRLGIATVVTDAADVLDIVAGLGEAESPERWAEPTSRDALDEPARRVLEALALRSWRAPAAIARAAGLDIATVRRQLALLTASDFAEVSDGGWRQGRRMRAER
jgi:DNA processing protein